MVWILSFLFFGFLPWSFLLDGTATHPPPSGFTSSVYIQPKAGSPFPRQKNQTLDKIFVLLINCRIRNNFIKIDSL